MVPVATPSNGGFIPSIEAQNHGAQIMWLHNIMDLKHIWTSKIGGHWLVLLSLLIPSFCRNKLNNANSVFCHVQVISGNTQNFSPPWAKWFCMISITLLGIPLQLWELVIKLIFHVKSSVVMPHAPKHVQSSWDPGGKLLWEPEV